MGRDEVVNIVSVPGRCHHEPRWSDYRDSPTERATLGYTTDGEPLYYNRNIAYSEALDAFMGTLVETTCEYGNCVEKLCPQCGAMSWGYGPIECPCDDTMVFHEQRRAVGPNFLKPSQHRRGWRKRR